MLRKSIATFDDQLRSDEFFIDPYPTYHRLREHAPVYWSDVLGGWVITRYVDLISIFRDPQRFSSAGRVTYLLNQLPDAARSQVEQLERHYNVGIAHSDPPDHTRLRALFTKVFTPRMVERMRPRIESVVNDLLARVERAERMDIIGDLAYPLPAIIISEMIGAPTEDRDKFRQWAIEINGLFEGGGRIIPRNVEIAQRALLEMRAYVRELIERKRVEPHDDILSGLVAAEEQGEKLAEAELVSTVVTLFVAGHETTTNLIGNGMHALLHHPDQLARLHANPGLIVSAVEELLRYDTSVQRGWRIAREDVEFGGAPIRRGDLVLPMLGAANRDPAQFPNPDVLDIERKENRHVAFGYGIHFCLGAPLARLEAPIAINALLAKFPNLGLTGESLAWRQDIALRGLITLPVLLR
jgi:pimeloyl-[acyl-carrier protein] synthase